MKKTLLSLLIVFATLGFANAQSPKIAFHSCTPDVIDVEKDVEVTITMINKGDVATDNNTIVTISSDSQYIKIIDDTAVYGTMEPNETKEGTFVVRINQMIPDNSKIHFNIKATLENSSIASNVYYDFEDGSNGWTNIDADGDGFCWIESCSKSGPGKGHESEYCMLSQSYDNTFDILYPDNYLVSPQKFKVAKDASISFWACAHDKFYPYEHFGVAISKAGNTSDNDFTTIKEWTLDSIAPSRIQGEWINYIVDLSEYEEEEIWIAIRHFDCFDQFYIDIDDIELINVYQPIAWEERFAVAAYSPTPNLVLSSHNCGDIAGGDTKTFEVTIINNGSGATTYDSKVTLSTNDKYVTIVDGEDIIGALAFNQTANASFTISTDASMPKDHPITFNINIEPNELYDENVDFTYQFEKNLEGWTTLDANADEHTWYHTSDYDAHDVIAVKSHSGRGHIMSESACNALLMGLEPDDYIICPNKIGVKENTTFSFWACAQDEDCEGERFGVAVSTESNTSAYDFLTIKKWTLATSQRAGDWIKYSIDLSDYAGEFVWVAIRHFDCQSIFIICVDDINISNYVRCHNWKSSFTINGEASLEENHDIFKIYPNPVEDKLSIETNDVLQEISIYDVNGKLIYNERKDISNIIDMTDFTSGTYFLKIKTDKDDIIKKFVKN